MNGRKKMKQATVGSKLPKKPAKFDWFAKQLGIEKQEDWYLVHGKDLRDFGLQNVMYSHGSSMVQSLRAAYPEFEWKVWKFQRLPQHWYTDFEIQKEYVEWLSEELNLKQLDDWYKVTRKDVVKTGGRPLLSAHGGSLIYMLQTIYPEHDWKPWKFFKAPNNYWESKINHRIKFDDIAQQLGITKFEDWYNFTGEQIKELGAAGVMAHYSGSLVDTLKAVYSEFDWQETLFQQSPLKLLEQPQSHRRVEFRKFCDYLAAELGIKVAEDWYNVTRNTVKHVTTPGALRVLRYHKYSLADMLQTAYPEFEWNRERFENYDFNPHHQLPMAWWTKKENHKKFVDWVAKKFGIEQQMDWYSVRGEDIHSIKGGVTLLDYYSGSVIKLLRTVYPQYDWCPWLFAKVPSKYWMQKDNQRKCFDWLAMNLQIDDIQQWRNVNSEMVKELGGNSLLSRYNGSLAKALEAIYPEYEWGIVFNLSEGQEHVWTALKLMLKTDIKVNYKMFAPTPNSWFELDVYIPAFNLAIEYQGMQHYLTPEGVGHFGGSRAQQIRDERKRELCKSLGICLIEIPYWWNNSPAALVSSIRKHRPELNIKIPQQISRQFSSTFQEQHRFNNRKSSFFHISED